MIALRPPRHRETAAARTSRRIVLAVVASLFLHACGGSDDNGNRSVSSQSTEAAIAAEPTLALITSPVGQVAPDAATLPRWDPPAGSDAPPLANYQETLTCAVGVPPGPPGQATIAYASGRATVTSGGSLIVTVTAVGSWTRRSSVGGTTYSSAVSGDSRFDRLSLIISSAGRLSGFSLSGPATNTTIQCGDALPTATVDPIIDAGNGRFAWTTGTVAANCVVTIVSPSLPGGIATETLQGSVRFVANGQPVMSVGDLLIEFPSAAEFGVSAPGVTTRMAANDEGIVAEYQTSTTRWLIQVSAGYDFLYMVYSSSAVEPTQVVGCERL